jgi:hypothetical protein
MGLAEGAFGLVIIGGGPAGLATLLAAHKTGQLAALLSLGVAIVDRSEHLGAGSIGQYAINSDSGGRTFVDCLDSSQASALTRLRSHPLTTQLAAAGDGPVPLRDAGRFLGLVGEAVETIMDAHPACALFMRHEALAARRVEDGWSLEIRDGATGATRRIAARQVIVAAGGHQPPQRMTTERIGGLGLAERCGDRLLQSGEVLTAAGLTRVDRKLAGKAEPRVAIIGGSTSAAAVAHALLHRLPDVAFGDGGITLLHRRPLRIYYPDRQSALAEGYTEWTEADVCQISGRVFRFAGFRLDSRELIMQARGIGGRPPEPRLRLHHLRAEDTTAARLIDTADLVVAAMGYRPRALPLQDGRGAPLPLFADTGPQAPMVDDQCRVLDDAGKPIPDLYGIGLAAGFVPRGPLGGEASFRGQANGLWLWQHDVGALIVRSVLAAAQAAQREQDTALPAAAALMNAALHLSASVAYG